MAIPHPSISHSWLGKVVTTSHLGIKWHFEPWGLDGGIGVTLMPLRAEKPGTSNTGLSPSASRFARIIRRPLGCTIVLQYQETTELAASMPIALRHFFLAELSMKALSGHCWALELSCLLLPCMVLLAKPGVNHPSPLLIPGPGLADKELHCPFEGFSK